MNQTVEAVRSICEADGKRCAVLISVNDSSTLFTTWGKSPEDKLYAKELSEHISDVICEPGPTTVHESFVVQAAEIKAALETAVSALKRAEQFISNGIEFGYIDEPKPGQPEAQTLGIIRDAILQATIKLLTQEATAK